MSASLVGSEMCIRDSPRGARDAGRRPARHRDGSPVDQDSGLRMGPPGLDQGLGAGEGRERAGPRGRRPQADACRQDTWPDGLL
eukprot:4232618-Alexandrium_andersonii.AAC.1